MSAYANVVRTAENSEESMSTTAEYLSAMARAVTGVSVVATNGTHGRAALTVSAVASVSAEPPLLLICVARRNLLRAAIINNGVFSVNLLAADQSTVADTFAGRGPGVPFDFEVASWRNGETGAPVMVDATASFDCVVETAHESGTHTIVIGRVITASTRSVQPLLYTMRAYGEPAPLVDASTEVAALD